MNGNKRVYLAAIRRDLMNQYHYESRKKRNQAFEILYHGWRRKCVRHGQNTQFFTVSWQRGWIGKRFAKDLREYIGLS